ncbi:MAG: efflux RND transporter periplasmic adaptor subunit [Deltaproteobacteria bacterium]|nr:efflux RND transporter periplasmic adaptor subunit [Deltaproteobacteria bacterium]
MKRKILWIVLGLVVAGIVALIVVSAVSEPKVSVNTKKVERKDIVQTVSASGKIQPVVKVDLSAYVSGEITRIPVIEGQAVKRGELLVELDSTRYQASRDQLSAAKRAAESQVALARANLDQSERDLKRLEQLATKDLVSATELERARTTLQVQEATMRTAEDQARQAGAGLRQAGDDLRKTTLTSPLDGVVIALNKKVGEIAIGSQFTRDVIMTVADVSAMEVKVEVDENDVPAIQLGQTAEVEVDAFPDRKFKGEVTMIGHSAKTTALGTQEETTNFDVTVTIRDDVSLLRSGMSATANVVTDTRTGALAVPIQCVTMRDPTADPKKPVGQVQADKLKDVAYKVEDGRSKMTVIETGISSEFDIEIKTGLDEGAELVCGPYKTLNKDLKEGDLLEIGEETAPTEDDQAS